MTRARKILGLLSIALLAVASLPDGMRLSMAHHVRCSLTACLEFKTDSEGFREPILSGDGFGFRRYLATHKSGATQNFVLLYNVDRLDCVPKGSQKLNAGALEFFFAEDNKSVRECFFESRTKPSGGLSKAVDFVWRFCCGDASDGVALISMIHPDKQIQRGTLFFNPDRSLVVEASSISVMDNIRTIPSSMLTQIPSRSE